jgi:hypothetical protein
LYILSIVFCDMYLIIDLRLLNNLKNFELFTSNIRINFFINLLESII